MRRLRVVMMISLLLLPIAAEAKNAAELQLQMKKLTVVGSALYIAAHPDDENTAMLAWLSNGRLVRTGYLSMTRGDGGQNLIGDEKGPYLGMIRTEELLAARKVDGAEQFFTRALDFGFTKNPEETFRFWDHDTILADVVWTIRKFQPDVLITRFPTTGEGGHGQHTASAILAVEAFKAAGDPTKFPEQLKYVGVWQPKRIFWNRFSWQPVNPDSPEIRAALKVDLGEYNALLGRAYTEIAAESRSQHKSQGFGSAERRGSLMNYLTQLDGDPAKQDAFDGIDTTWSRYAGGDAVGKLLQQASDTFDVKKPAASIPLLLQALDAIDRLGASDAWSPRAHPWVDVKRQEILSAIRDCAGLSIDVSAADASIVPGGSIPVSVTVVNRSDYPFTLSTVASLYANPGKAPGTPLKNNQPVKTDITIQLPADFPVTQPYFFSEPPSKGMYKVTDQQLVGMPRNDPAFPVVVTLDDNQMHTLVFKVPVVYRWTDPVRGERTRNVDVMPPVVATVEGGVFVFPDAKSKTVSVRLQSFIDNATGTLRLNAPQGWAVTPAAIPFSIAKKRSETVHQFTVTPPAGNSTGTLSVELETAGAKGPAHSFVSLEYDHIQPQRVLNDAAAKLVRADVKKRGTKIGYIMGSGDEVPDALRQIGYDVTVLTDADLERGSFSGFDAIVAGVRAYNTRKRLAGAQAKLLDYVKNGGTYVVQYNTTDELVTDQVGPYPFKISRDRVTVEEAPMTLLRPDHVLLTAPNKITAADFDGWVQERGLYYTTGWDPQYQTIFAANDPGEKPLEGGEIYAKYGKGTFVYSPLAWFRQLPAGVPGAYRLFANMVSAK